MRAKDAPRLSAIRLLLSAMKQKEVDERVELSDADVVAIIDKMLKQRRESIAQHDLDHLRPGVAHLEWVETRRRLQPGAAPDRGRLLDRLRVADPMAARRRAPRSRPRGLEDVREEPMTGEPTLSGRRPASVLPDRVCGS